jgi:DNA-binding GntR family transcriptional regulator
MSDNYQLTDEKVFLDRPKPVAIQITELLRNRIVKGQYRPNGRLPSEPDLSRWLGVSRATIRTALATLAAEGLIIRRRGAGTFVNKQAIEIASSTSWDFTKLIENSGRAALIRVHSVEQRLPTKDEAFVLQIDVNQEVISLTRVIEADGFPAIYSINVMPVSLVQVTHNADAYKEPIFDFLAKYCGQEYDFCIVEVTGVQADAQIAKVLHVEEGVAIIRLEEVFYNCQGLPLFWAINFFNGKEMRLRFIKRRENL